MGISAYLAWAASTTRPPSAWQSAVLVVGGSAFQLGGATLLARSGRADPALARVAVRDLITLTLQVRAARQRAESSYASDTPAEAKRTMGLVSLELSWIEQGVAAAAQNWAEFHPAAIERLKETDQ